MIGKIPDLLPGTGKSKCFIDGLGNISGYRRL